MVLKVADSADAATKMIGKTAVWTSPAEKKSKARLPNYMSEWKCPRPLLRKRIARTSSGTESKGRLELTNKLIVS